MWALPMNGSRWCSQHDCELDVLDQHHLVVLLGERLLQVNGRVGVQPAEDLGVHAGDAVGRFEQPFAVRVFADGREDLAHGLADSLLIDTRGVRYRSSASHAALQPRGRALPVSAGSIQASLRERADTSADSDGHDIDADSPCCIRSTFPFIPSTIRPRRTLRHSACGHPDGMEVSLYPTSSHLRGFPKWLSPPSRSRSSRSRSRN